MKAGQVIFILRPLSILFKPITPPPPLFIKGYLSHPTFCSSVIESAPTLVLKLKSVSIA